MILKIVDATFSMTWSMWKIFKNILLYCIGYMTMNSVKPLHLIVNKMNGYIEESHGNK